MSIWQVPVQPFSHLLRDDVKASDIHKKLQEKGWKLIWLIFRN